MSFEAARPGMPRLRLWAIKYQLNTQQERFVLSYAEHFDPRRAAMDAGVTPQNAKSIATKYLGMVKVQRALKAHVFEMKDISEKYREAIISELSAIVTADLKDIFDDGFRLKSVAEWPWVWSSGRVGRVDVKYAPGDTSGVPVSITVVGSQRQWALEKLFRYFGLDGRPGHQRIDNKVMDTVHEGFRQKSG